MAKELFNGILISTPTEPADEDRIALNQPGVQGSKNIRWDYLKALLQGALDKIIFNLGLSNPSYQEGVMFYDDTKKAVSYYNDVSTVTVNAGREILIRVYNDTGSLISNGSIVYPTGLYNGVPTIGLADASEKDKCRLVGMATHDIANGAYGYVTRLGEVGGLNTSALSAGILYLSDTTPGAWTQTRPIDGSYEIIIGDVAKVDAADGVIVIDPVVSQLTVEVTGQNGFPLDQKDACTISFVDGTRTFSITPTGASFHYYQTGDKFKQTSQQDVIITNTTGLHAIYFDEDTLTALETPTTAQIEDIVLNKCFVALIYWNATAGASILVNDERHGSDMSPTTHLYLHRTRGAQYLDGITPSSYVVDGDGSSNTHVQVGFTTGRITDEDLESTLDAVTSTSGLRYIYRSGASGIWAQGTNSGYIFPVGATPAPQYNQWTGATWQLTEITNNYIYCVHIFASADIDAEPIAIPGIAQYANVALATTGAANEIGTIFAGLPGPEFVPICTFLIERKSSFTNTNECRFVSTADGDDYINWLDQEVGVGSSPSNHNNLAGLELAGTGVTWGHIDDQAQTIYGEKTFNANLKSNGQAHGGHYTIPYSASITFNCNNGNIQGTTFTGDSTLSFSNELPGTYIYNGRISGTGVSSITLDSSWGDPIDNNADITYNDGDTFKITVVVDDLGNKEYTINIRTA